MRHPFQNRESRHSQQKVRLSEPQATTLGPLKYLQLVPQRPHFQV